MPSSILTRLAELGESNITLELLVKRRLVGKNDLVKSWAPARFPPPSPYKRTNSPRPAQEKIAKAGGKVELLG